MDRNFDVPAGSGERMRDDDGGESVPELPKTYVNFRETFPKLADAYDRLGAAAHEAGPMTAKERELVKLGIAIGARQEGAVHSHTRRALENGAAKEEVLQVVALAVTSIGFGPSVAAFSWVTDELGDE